MADLSEQEELLRTGEIITNDYIQGGRNANGEIPSTAEYNRRCTTKRAYQLREGSIISISNVDSGFKAAIAGVANGSFVYQEPYDKEQVPFVFLYYKALSGIKASYYFRLLLYYEKCDHVVCGKHQSDLCSTSFAAVFIRFVCICYGIFYK